MSTSPKKRWNFDLWIVWLLFGLIVATGNFNGVNCISLPGTRTRSSTTTTRTTNVLVLRSTTAQTATGEIEEDDVKRQISSATQMKISCSKFSIVGGIVDLGLLGGKQLLDITSLLSPQGFMTVMMAIWNSYYC